MTSHGYTNDDTFGVAVACENTASFQSQYDEIADRARRADVDGAADQLEAEVTGGAVATTLGSWVNTDLVNWRELVTTWASNE